MQPFEQELAGLKEKLLTMASHAESSVGKAVEALGKRDYDLALRVQTEDGVIDRFEVEVDELAISLLARSPRASDLRLITVAMKISQNLERVGDETTTIARRVQDLCQELPLKLVMDIPQMAAFAVQMLKSALDAFVNQDPAAARALIPQDKQIDLLNKQIHRQLAEQMIAAPDTIPRCLNVMVISKSLERIGDHAKNVAEEVVYLCEAQDIRHKGRGEADPAGNGGVSSS
jgi:phosphate transport system protein